MIGTLSAAPCKGVIVQKANAKLFNYAVYGLNAFIVLIGAGSDAAKMTDLVQQAEYLFNTRGSIC